MTDEAKTSRRRRKAVQVSKSIKCNDTDCDEGLHCFNRSDRPTRRHKGVGRVFRDPGICGMCGEAGVIDWPRVHTRDLADAVFKLEAMRNEYIRDHFWVLPVPETLRYKAVERGREELFGVDVPKVVKAAVGRAQTPWDGRQVKIDPDKMSSVIPFAQHAVAACCRKCVQKWHDIDVDHDLSDEEIEYLVGLVCVFLDARLPELSDGEAPDDEEIA